VRRAAALLFVAAIVVAGCGGSDSGDETTPTPPPPKQRHAEDADPLPELPAGWKPYLNRPGGFAVGLPPGWKASRKGTGSLIRSFDRLVAVSISPDRTPDAQDLDLDEFATRASLALPGVTADTQPSDPKSYDHHYDAVESKYEAKDQRSGVKQRDSLIVIRRDHLVTFTVLIAASADPQARPAEELARKVVATLRSQPPSA
jgi:hypothetical protein